MFSCARFIQFGLCYYNYVWHGEDTIDIDGFWQKKKKKRKKLIGNENHNDISHSYIICKTLYPDISLFISLTFNWTISDVYNWYEGKHNINYFFC